jgi:hypothetical protein
MSHTAPQGEFYGGKRSPTMQRIDRRFATTFRAVSVDVRAPRRPDRQAPAPLAHGSRRGVPLTDEDRPYTLELPTEMIMSHGP